MLAFILSPLGRRLAGVATVAALIAAAAWWIYDRGADDAIDKVEKDNAEASDAASQARLDRARCRLAGGVWRFETGKCERP